MKEASFKSGDIVRLKSGGPPMTVSGVFYLPSGDIEISLVYVNANSCISQIQLNEDILIPVQMREALNG